MAGIEPTVAYEYDDLDLVQRPSSVVSRADLDLTTRFSRNVNLRVPLVSAVMDTVTGSEMAIALAEEGALGVLHRACPIKEQAKEVGRVKRAARYVIEEPRLLMPGATVADARAILDEYGVGGILVVESLESRKLVGVLSRRDMTGETGLRKVGELMNAGGRRELVAAPETTTMEEAEKILHEHRIEKLPLVQNGGTLAGLITEKDINKVQKFPNATRDALGRLVVGAGIGIKDADCYDRAEALVDAGVDVLVIDVAHGGLERVSNVAKEIVKRFPKTDLVVGNVMTGELVERLIDAGAAGVKVGIAPGYACRTRSVTGVGGGQMTVISECAAYAVKNDVPVCADGGTRHYGDIGKALAAGASTVMVGSLIAGTLETPPPIVTDETGRQYKSYRGMASRGANIAFQKAEGGEIDTETLQATPEGAELRIPLRGSVREIVWHIEKALRSTMSYIGARSIADMPKQAKWRQNARSGQSK